MKCEELIKGGELKPFHPLRKRKVEGGAKKFLVTKNFINNYCTMDPYFCNFILISRKLFKLKDAFSIILRNHNFISSLLKIIFLVLLEV